METDGVLDGLIDVEGIYVGKVDGRTDGRVVGRMEIEGVLDGPIDVEGVYDDQKKLITEIKPFDLENLIKWKVVQGGMIPKIQNCVDAVGNGVRGVVILDGRKSHSILHEIFSDQGSGTLIRE